MGREGRHSGGSLLAAVDRKQGWVWVVPFFLRTRPGSFLGLGPMHRRGCRDAIQSPCISSPTAAGPSGMKEKAETDNGGQGQAR
jgi:hypothetical protein